MSDNFGNHAPTLDSPGLKHRVITPGTGVLAPKPRTLYFDTAGTVTIEDINGTSITYNVTAGQILPFRAHKVTAATAVVIGWE